MLISSKRRARGSSGAVAGIRYGSGVGGDATRGVGVEHPRLSIAFSNLSRAPPLHPLIGQRLEEQIAMNRNLNRDFNFDSLDSDEYI